MEKKMTMQEEFTRLAQRDDVQALIMGSITKDLGYPQVGMTGSGVGVLMIIASAVRQYAIHTEAHAETVLGIIQAMIDDIDQIEKEDDQGKVVQ